MTDKVRPAVLLFAIAALAFSLGYVVFPHEEGDHDPLARDYSGLELNEGVPAADFAVQRLDGTELSSESLKGQILVVDFWATWCGPCLTEIPSYNALHEDYADRDVQLLGITLQSGSADQVRDWIAQPIKLGAEEFKLTYPVVMGNDDMEYSWGPIYGFPTTYLVDADWKVRKRWIGAVPDKSEQLRILIDRLIEERAAGSE